MKGHKPVIGISPGYDIEKDRVFVNSGYYEAICHAGGIPLIIPVISDYDILDRLMEQFDGLLLCGGPDVDARVYGESNKVYNGGISPLRDIMELFLSKKAMEINKPLLGICRGIQIMNVAAGGTLYQDIPAQLKDREVLKHDQNAPYWYPTHDIKIRKGSRIWKGFEQDYIGVNSYHHQAVKDIGDGFDVVCESEDGIIEAIEHRNLKFAVGVQWHPELMWQKNEVYLQVFKELIDSCKMN